MINKKCNRENEVSSPKRAVPINSISEKVALAKNYNCSEKIGSLKSRGSEKVACSKTNFIKK